MTRKLKTAPNRLLDSSIVWKSIPRKGRGVFTTRPIKKGAVIEVAPVVPMAEKNVPDGDVPDGYVLEWNDRKRSEKYALVLGYIMLYNHSPKPNMKLKSNMRAKTIAAVALRPIRAGEELTWDYNCDVWFDIK